MFQNRGSVESLGSLQSSTLSFESDLSGGSLQAGQGCLKPSGGRDNVSGHVSNSSTTSSKKTRFAMGSEQTAV